MPSEFFGQTGTVDTLNKFCVAVKGDHVLILNLPLSYYRSEGSIMPEFPVSAPLTHEEALSLAAWLVAVTGKRERFLELLHAVENT